MTYIRTNDSPPVDYIMVALAIPCNRQQVSDGYHTFEELYQHCNALFARLCVETRGRPSYKTEVYHQVGGYYVQKAVLHTPKSWLYRDLPLDMWEQLPLAVREGGDYPTGLDALECSHDTIECLLGQPMPTLKPNTECLPHVITVPGSHYLEVPCLIGQVSDGTNTFDDLYAMRHALFVALCHEMAERGAWKSLLHEDGTSYEGYFIAGIELPEGMITYHLPMELWDILKVEALDKGRPWDGHTAADVVDRLLRGL